MKENKDISQEMKAENTIIGLLFMAFVFLCLGVFGAYKIGCMMERNRILGRFEYLSQPYWPEQRYEIEKTWLFEGQGLASVDSLKSKTLDK